MALIACTECNSTISSQAKNCPHCGISLHKSSNGALKFLLITTVVVLGVYAGFYLYDRMSIQEIEASSVMLNEDQYIGVPINLDKTIAITISGTLFRL